MKKEATPPRFSNHAIRVAMYVLTRIAKPRGDSIERAKGALADMLHIQSVPADDVAERTGALWAQLVQDGLVAEYFHPGARMIAAYPAFRITGAGNKAALRARTTVDLRRYFAVWNQMWSIHQAAIVAATFARVVRSIPGRVPRRVCDALVETCASPFRTKGARAKRGKN